MEWSHRHYGSLTLTLTLTLAVMGGDLRAAEPGPPEPAPAPVTPPARRADGPPLGLAYDFLLGGRTNPLGSIADVRFRYRQRLYQSHAAALEQNFVSPVLGVGLTPQFFRPAVGAELQPLSILSLYAGYEPVYWMGTVGSLHSYPTAASEFGGGPWSTAPPYNPGDTYAQYIHQVVLSATVRLKVKSIGFRTMLRGAYTHATLRGGDTVFYDSLMDLVVPARGWHIYHETDLAWLSSFGLTVGVRHALTHAFYPAEALPAPPPGSSTSDNPVTPISRLGPFVAYTFHERPGARFDSPTILLMASWYLAHRYRAGELVSQGIPSIVVGLSFRGSLLDGGGLGGK